MTSGNTDPGELDPLIRDLLQWIERSPRTYDEVMDAWRTSCPRLTVWEDAVDRGFVERLRTGGATTEIRVTALGQAFLERPGELQTEASGWQSKTLQEVAS